MILLVVFIFPRSNSRPGRKGFFFSEKGRFREGKGRGRCPRLTSSSSAAPPLSPPHQEVLFSNIISPAAPPFYLIFLSLSSSYSFSPLPPAEAQLLLKDLSNVSPPLNNSFIVLCSFPSIFREFSQQGSSPSQFYSLPLCIFSRLILLPPPPIRKK